MASLLRQGIEFVPALTKPAKALVVVAHGLGDDASGWTFLADQMRSMNKQFNDVAFVFPTAPIRPVTVSMGMPMTAWYDIPSFNFHDVANGDGVPPAGLMDSKKTLHEIISQYSAKVGLSPARAILGGFSQGGAMTVVAGLTYPHALGGLFVLSGYLPMRKDKALQMFDDEGKGVNKETPMLMLHGQADGVVKMKYGSMTDKVLREAGYSPSFESFSGVEHSIDQRGLLSLSKYLLERIESFKTLPEAEDKPVESAV